MYQISALHGTAIVIFYPQIPRCKASRDHFSPCDPPSLGSQLNRVKLSKRVAISCPVTRNKKLSDVSCASQGASHSLHHSFCIGPLDAQETGYDSTETQSSCYLQNCSMFGLTFVIEMRMVQQQAQGYH